jgi:4-methylaminobutanoate oxidase (formaldehyde-forming)
MTRAYEVYSTYYEIHYPGEERTAGRPLKTAPTYSRLQALEASFGEKSGWERANWFDSNEDPAHEARRPRGWAGEHWSTAIVTEHLATRESAGLFDESSFAKIEVSGPGAVAFLQRLCSNDVDRAADAVIYTQMLNARGGIECDLTVSRLAEDRFLLVTGTAFGNHDIGWIRKQLWDWAGEPVSVRDVTASLACFGLWGPRSREILGAVTSSDLSNEAFGYMKWRDVVVGDVPCRALRVTYVGELGWELYASVEFAGRLWDTLMHAGAPHGMVPAGYRAIDSLRLEKGYRAWGADITPEENPFQAGLGFAVRMDKPGFIGNEALEKAQASVTSRLSCLTLADERAICLGNEPVFNQGKVVSRVTSGGIGYSVGASIAYAYLPVELASPGTPCQIEVFGEKVGATVVAEPLWDAKGARIRA